MTYMIASSVEWSAHCRSSITKYDGPLCAPPIQPRVEPQHELAPSVASPGSSSRASAMKRNAERIGRNGIDIDVSGRHPPNRIVDDPPRSAHTRAMRAVLPTPGSPATTTACASPAAERSRRPPMTPSSSTRPTTPCSRSPEGGHDTSLASDSPEIMGLELIRGAAGPSSERVHAWPGSRSSCATWPSASQSRVKLPSRSPAPGRLRGSFANLRGTARCRRR